MKGEPLQLVVLYLGLLPLSPAQTCYFADGSSTVNDSLKWVPCGQGSATCCVPEGSSEGGSDVCLSNGMCYYLGGHYFYRGGCTDSMWNSDDCTHQCQNRTLRDIVYLGLFLLMHINQKTLQLGSRLHDVAVISSAAERILPAATTRTSCSQRRSTRLPTNTVILSTILRFPALLHRRLNQTGQIFNS